MLRVDALERAVTHHPNVRVHQHVHELRPLASVDLRDSQRTGTVWFSSTELEWMRRDRRAARVEFQNPPDAPTLCVIGRTSEGFLLVTVKGAPR